MTVRRPRHWLSVQGALIPLITSNVTRKSRQNADTFQADISITASEALGFGLAEWANWDESQDVSIVYSVAPGGGDQVVMISGKLDQPQVTMSTMIVSITGRDKSSSLTEKRRNEKFLNQKSSDAVKKIAADHGLSPVVVDTGDYAGKLYSEDTAHLVLNRTDYETLNAFADREGYRWYVEGDNLFFEPKASLSGSYPIRWSPPGAQTPYAIGNCLDLVFGKNSTAGRPTKVTAAGWHHGKKKLFKYTAQASGRGDPIEYRFHHNGNVEAQLQKKAKSKLHDIIRHELSIEATLPGDLALDPRMQVSLTGTGTVFDQSFDIDAISFDMGWDQPFTMRVDGNLRNRGEPLSDDGLIDLIRREAATVSAMRNWRGTVVVTSYDPKKHAMKGILVPHEVETGWIPIGAGAIGNGFGDAMAPKPGDAQKLDGDQFAVQFDAGDANTLVATHRIFSDVDVPPELQSGEMIRKHACGNLLYMKADKSMLMEHYAAKGVINWDPDGNLTIDAKGKNIDLKTDGGTITVNGQKVNLTGSPVDING